jgi:hypothetical protein
VGIGTIRGIERYPTELTASMLGRVVLAVQRKLPDQHIASPDRSDRFYMELLFTGSPNHIFYIDARL